MGSNLTQETISAISASFQQAVASGIYEKKQIVRVYEPSKIRDACYQALHWQVTLEMSSKPEDEEARKKEKKLARRIFVCYFTPYLSCISLWLCRSGLYSVLLSRIQKSQVLYLFNSHNQSRIMHSGIS